MLIEGDKVHPRDLLVGYVVRIRKDINGFASFEWDPRNLKIAEEPKVDRLGRWTFWCYVVEKDGSSGLTMQVGIGGAHAKDFIMFVEDDGPSISC